MDDVRAHAQPFCSVQWMPLHAVWLVIAVDSSHPKKVFAVCTLREALLGAQAICCVFMLLTLPYGYSQRGVTSNRDALSCCL